MSCEIVQINAHTWRIEDGGVRFFLLEGDERALLIDSGMTAVDARDIAESLTDRPLSLLNTHADRDHIAGNARFDACYMHPDEAPLYRRGGGSCVILPIREGDALDLGGRELRIIELPGHTPGSVAVLDVAARVLISGDPIQDGRIFMFGGHRDLRRYAESLDRLAARREDFDEIWPSHASIPVSPDLIPKLRDGARDILAGKLRGKTEEFHGQRIQAIDLGFATFLCDA